ncbi:ribbon-helix-helix domain-containing protein [Streptomyces sp. NPDC004232]|uniref:ribbon-helix-helix domain-containing protein n=1 Tax=Streptomyces sp. NPDC004232 TaxID=3154454 RepID=UPI0033B6AA33
MPATVSSAADVGMTHVNFKLATKAVEAIDEKARRTGNSRTSVLRHLIDDWLLSQEREDALSA